MTHQQCLYCGRELQGTQACGCEWSQIKWTYKYEYTPKTTKPDINSLYLQDLLFLAKELPKIEFLNHEEQVVANYKLGGWVKVNDYILFVHQLHAILYPNKPLWRKILDNVADWFTKVKLYLKTIV
jgi:hypothetical protein